MKSVFCIPYAGGSSYMYSPFKDYLKDYKIITYDLPGRGRRVSENQLESFQEAIIDCTDALLSQHEYEDMVVFGYSMGGLLAFECVYKIYRERRLLPNKLFIASCESPLQYDENREISKPDDDQLCKYLIESGGVSEETINNPDFLSFFLPIIKTDFAMLDSYSYTGEGRKLPIKMHILYSSDEKEITEWDEFSEKKNSYRYFDGGHFFIRNCYKEICEAIDAVANE